MSRERDRGQGPELDSAPERGRHGGRRPGAGRPKGVREVLPRGAVKAIKALRHRVPEGTAAPLAEVADEAFAAVVAVMRKPATPGAFARLQAAAAIREEVCGPVPKKHELAGPGGAPIPVSIAINTRGDK